MSFHTAICPYGVLFLLAFTAISGVAGEDVTIFLREPAGILRPSYPVAAMFTLPGATAEDLRFRLLDEGGSPIAAQFRSDQTRGSDRVFWLDFQADLKPHASRTYTVQSGPDVERGPERASGHRLTETPTAWNIENAPYLTWTIPRDLSGLVTSLSVPPVKFLRATSPGLTIVDRTGTPHALADQATNTIVSRVVRAGRFAVALRFEVTASTSALQGVRSIIDLHFPVSRSWMEVDWKLFDPLGMTTGRTMELHLQLDRPATDAPTLVDFGATTLVYTALYPGQESELRATGTRGLPTRQSDSSPVENGGQRHSRPGRGQSQTDERPDPAWKVLRGPSGDLKPFFVAPLEGTQTAEGWAHVMDRRKCLALAISEFGRRTDDRISISADGSVTLERNSPESGVSKNHEEAAPFRFWLHFVRFPPQHGAGTSPQAMQNPIDVQVLRGPKSP
ncbi:MAG: hypothetical protein ABGZ35_18860 [Planctomycetaceae bacterium]|jgi:hypothetical protein